MGKLESFAYDIFGNRFTNTITTRDLNLPKKIITKEEEENLKKVFQRLQKYSEELNRDK